MQTSRPKYTSYSRASNGHPLFSKPKSSALHCTMEGIFTAYDPNERRQLRALRAHIDTLRAAGASLEGRNPLRFAINGQRLLVRHGTLVSENGNLNVIETLARIEWDSEQQRNQTIEVCLDHLSQAIDQTELSLQS